MAYDTVRNRAPPSEQGSSLEDVRNALLAHDVQCAVLRLQLTDLSSVHYPFILHVNHRGGLAVGHFFLLTGVDRIGLHTYDPVTSLKRHWPWQSFGDVWSGYAILPTRTTIRNDQRLLSYLLGIHVLVLAFAALRRNVRSGPINPARMRGFVAFFIVLIFGLLHPVDAAAEEQLRSNLKDGANAAALLGGIYGVEMPPGEAAGTDPIDSLDGIQLRLEENGVATSARLLSYQELVSCARPCVVPLRFVNTEKTSFCVFVQATDADVHLVEAGPLTVRSMPVDDFRRYWTGYAVFGNVADRHYGELFGWALFGFGLPFSCRVMIIYGRQLLNWLVHQIRRIRVRFATAFFVVSLTIASSRSDGSPPPILPTDVHAALNKNASLFSNVLITGERSHRPLAPVETVLKRCETTESEADFTTTLHFELRFQGPLFRESIEYPPGNAYTHDVLHEISFDGIQYRLGYKSLEQLANSSISIYTPVIATQYGKLHDRANSLARMEFWYVRETGFTGSQTLATLGQPVASAILNATAHDRIVSVSEVAGGSETFLEVIIEQPEPWQSAETFDIETHQAYASLLNGTDILQKRMERERRQLAGKYRVIRFWLNSARGYAVEEKWESRKETGETMFHTKNSEFVQVAPDGVWMPKRCVVESHAYYTAPLSISPDPMYETVIQMDQCVPGNFDDDQFRIWYDIPGAQVSDWTSPKATLNEADSYTVPFSIDEWKGNSSRLTRWLVILNVLFIAGWLGWWWCSRPRKERSEV